MKTVVYMRIAKGPRGYQFHAGKKPSAAPLSDSSSNALPTVAFGLALDIPNKLFDQAAQVIAELTIPEDQATIAAEVHQ